VTPGDVLEKLIDLLPEKADLIDSMNRFTVKGIHRSQWIRLREAGSPTAEKLKLADIGIDLPARTGEREDIPAVVEYVIRRADFVRRGVLSADRNKHIVLVGGPGQGKSTLAQMICQVYRLALMAGRPSSRIPEIAEIIERFSSRIERLGINLPNLRRWPIYVKLSEYGEEIGAGSDLDLVRYMCSRINKLTLVDITPAQLMDWLHEWPWLVVLDGLDEVAAPEAREAVEDEVSQFLMDVSDADVFVVATTRPQGYNNEFSSALFEHVRLRLLDNNEALRYGSELARVRHHDDEDVYENVVAGLKLAASSVNTQRLMRTPLQITIMSILVERRVRVPDSRYKLFEEYYRTIYDREVSKPGSTGQLLEDRRKDIDYLHEAVAVRLHHRSAQNTRRQLFSLSELQHLAYERLVSKGLEDEAAQKLAARMVKASTHRLVLLAPVEQDYVGYDVRSLQEFMAAKFITSGPERRVVDRLRKLAASLHWRNVWLFAAGKIFSGPEHLCDELVSILVTMDNTREGSLLFEPSGKLALDLLDDAVAVNEPLYQRTFIKQSLSVLTQPPRIETVRLAGVHNLVLKHDSKSASIVLARVREMTGSGGWLKLTAILYLASFVDSGGVGTGTARTLLHAALNSLTDFERRLIAEMWTLYPSDSLKNLREQGLTPRLVTAQEILSTILECMADSLIAEESTLSEGRKEILRRIEVLRMADASKRRVKNRDGKSPVSTSSQVMKRLTSPIQMHDQEIIWQVGVVLHQICQDLPMEKWKTAADIAEGVIDSIGWRTSVDINWLMRPTD
jgi:energy-coupling factor transporter ATP-binding protein EcfA2